MSVDTVIANGTVVTPNQTFEGSVAINDGRIVAVGDRTQLPDGERVVDATGNLVMPGVVDPHVHIDEVPENRAGTYRAETSAAALGGVTTIIDFAFQSRDRAMSDETATVADGVRHKQAKGEADALVDFSFHGVIHREQPETLDELTEAVDMGVTSFKMFMSNYSIGVSNGFIAQALARIADLDAVAALHTEDPSVCDALTEKLKREGKRDPTHYPESRPDWTEAMAAEDAVRMAREAGAKYYGVHTTCRQSAEVIDQFQDDGSQIRAETCTHYTVLDDSIYAEMDNLPKIAPPIRKPDDIEAMFDYLDKGTLSVVSTDHSVYHQEYKEVDAWWESPFGANSIQVSLPVFHDEAVVTRGYSYPFLVRTMCTNPAQTFGMPQKGTLEPGTDADIVVFDPDAEFTITAAENASNAEFSVYEGRDVQGRVEKTFVRGELVADQGAVVGSPGTGEFVARELPDWSA